ncbi:MAG: hypothetical protein IT475_11800 [Aquimonas sp.]|nr:hypothetical protein [Aquimonas sp.]
MSNDKRPPAWPGKPRADANKPRSESTARPAREDWRPRESSPSGASPYRLPQPFAKPAAASADRPRKPGPPYRAQESTADRPPRREARREDAPRYARDTASKPRRDEVPARPYSADRDPRRDSRQMAQREDGNAATGANRSPYGQSARTSERTASASPWQRADRPEMSASSPRFQRDVSADTPALPSAAEAAWTPRQEQKIYGLNAVRAAFAARPGALRKVYLLESRLSDLRELLAHCVSERLGYRVVPAEDMDRLCASQHHEGVCVLMAPPELPSLPQLLASLLDEPVQRLIWLDGVGNPHNLGAVLRSAAHFGAAAVLLPEDSTLGLSSAAVRVAEGGAEVVPLLRLEDSAAAISMLHDAGFVLCATLPRDGVDLYAEALPDRAVFVFGAEAAGMRDQTIAHCDRRLRIPGSGKVESLNIANAVGVVLAEHWRQTMG